MQEKRFVTKREKRDTHTHRPTESEAWNGWQKVGGSHFGKQKEEKKKRKLDQKPNKQTNKKSKAAVQTARWAVCGNATAAKGAESNDRHAQNGFFCHFYFEGNIKMTFKNINSVNETDFDLCLFFFGLLRGCPPTTLLLPTQPSWLTLQCSACGPCFK